MTEESQPPFARLCLVTAVDIEFKAAVSLLAEPSYLGAQASLPAEADVSGSARTQCRQRGLHAQVKICRSRAGARQITVVQTGMGARTFADWFRLHLTDNSYDAVIIVGLAGGLEPSLQTGDVVIYDRCHDARRLFPALTSKEKPSARDEKASIACDARLSRFLLSKLQAARLSCRRGAGVTVGRILIAAADKRAIGARYAAAAADMETYDVLEVCVQRDVPAAALRIVSDDAQTELPDFNRAVGADGQLRGWRTAAVLLARPRVSLRFLRNINPALRALRASLRALLNT